MPNRSVKTVDEYVHIGVCEAIHNRSLRITLVIVAVTAAIVCSAVGWAVIATNANSVMDASQATEIENLGMRLGSHRAAQMAEQERMDKRFEKVYDKLDRLSEQVAAIR